MASDYERIETAIRFIHKQCNSQPSLTEIANEVGLSNFHFHRLFRRWAGITPKQFLQFLTVEHAKQMLVNSNLWDTSLELGLSGTSRLHDHFVTLEAVTPGEYKSSGKGLHIEYGIYQSPFGKAFISVTERGICQLAFVTQETFREPLDNLRENWSNAKISLNQKRITDFGNKIFRADGNPRSRLKIFVKGSNFQLNVWKSLLKIPPGTVCSYGQIAHTIQEPRACRAVANAIGTNPVAYLIPCHRVIRDTGALGGYHWGMERKMALHVFEAAKHINAFGDLPQYYGYW